MKHSSGVQTQQNRGGKTKKRVGYSFWIETTCFIDAVQEDSIQLVQLICMLLRGSWWLVDRLENQFR